MSDIVSYNLEKIPLESFKFDKNSRVVFKFVKFYISHF